MSRVPEAVRRLNPAFVDGTSLAEDNDYPEYVYQGDFHGYREWLEVRGDFWVTKSPDHLGQLAFLVHTFPEARFLWCMRGGADTLASMLEYWQVTGMQTPYRIDTALRDAFHLVEALPERFDCIWTPSIPEFSSERTGSMDSSGAYYIDKIQSKVRGLIRNVSSTEFTKLYS